MRSQMATACCAPVTQWQLRDHVNGVSDDVLRLFRVLGSTLYDFSIQGAVGSAQFPGACQARTLLNSETVKDEKARLVVKEIVHFYPSNLVRSETSVSRASHCLISR
jgi:hypothetical protein